MSTTAARSPALAFLAALVNGPREVWKRLVNILRGVRDIGPARAWALVETGGAVVLDVREPREFEAGHVPDSLFIPLGQIVERAGELDAHRGRPIVVICHGGKRSATACERLAKLGFTDLYNIAGGILAWRKAGLPETRSAA